MESATIPSMFEYKGVLCVKIISCRCRITTNVEKNRTFIQTMTPSRPVLYGVNCIFCEQAHSWKIFYKLVSATFIKDGSEQLMFTRIGDP